MTMNIISYYKSNITVILALYETSSNKIKKNYQKYSKT